MRPREIRLLLLAAVLFCSCHNRNGSAFSVLTPTSSGAPYEILMVADPENFQNGVTDAVTELLTSDIPGLPQPEGSFKVSKVTSDNFTHTLKYCRNILIIKLDRTFTAPKVKFSRDVYSQPQIIMTLQAPDAVSVEDYLEKYGQSVIDFFCNAELNREMNLLKEKHNKLVREKVLELFGCEVWIPSELNKTKTGKNFFWASTDHGDRDMNFVVYSYPYRDADTFTEQYFFDKRDSVMKANIPGPRDGQYMQTARPYVEVTDGELRGRYVQIARGLWEMKDYDMGGPFVSIGRVDEKNGTVVVAEGFVYAPGTTKRELMRRMEAAVYTLRLPEEIEENNFSYDIEEITIQSENN